MTQQYTAPLAKVHTVAGYSGMPRRGPWPAAVQPGPGFSDRSGAAVVERIVVGANIRFHEWRTERRIRAGATRGIRPPAVDPLEETLNPLPADGEPVKDRRQLVPALGLREYWWPALPSSKVPAKR